jgi:hypothetical protein
MSMSEDNKMINIVKYTKNDSYIKSLKIAFKNGVLWAPTAFYLSLKLPVYSLYLSVVWILYTLAILFTSHIKLFVLGVFGYATMERVNISDLKDFYSKI